MTWKQLTERDRREWKLSAINPHDRDTWRSGVRSAMRAASQLPGRGPTIVDMVCTLIKNPMMMNSLTTEFSVDGDFGQHGSVDSRSKQIGITCTPLG